MSVHDYFRKFGHDEFRNSAVSVVTFTKFQLYSSGITSFCCCSLVPSNSSTPLLRVMIKFFILE